MVTRRELIWSAVTAVGVASVSGCGTVISREERTRYRMSLIVQTPDGERRGSAVREIAYQPRALLSGSLAVFGEAIVIEITPRQTLFALLQSAAYDADYANNLLWNLWGRGAPQPIADTEDPPVTIWPRISRRAWRNGFRGDYARPLLVRFRDLADPMTIEKVEPDNLAAIFGEGVTLKRIEVALTHSLPTWGIRTKLPWLGEMDGGMLSGEHVELVQSRRLADRVEALDFVRPFPLDRLRT